MFPTPFPPSLYYFCMETLFFNSCTVDVDPHRGYVETLFDDKTSVPALPLYNPISLFYSRDLGYGEDVKLMTIHNQILHTFLMESAGFPYSPTLWATAHQEPCEVEYWERALVLSFQKFLNNREPDLILKDIIDELKKLKGPARKLLEFTYEV